MPGFGGLLDLTDSVLYAGPIAYLLWTVLPLRDLVTVFRFGTPMRRRCRMLLGG